MSSSVPALSVQLNAVALAEGLPVDELSAEGRAVLEASRRCAGRRQFVMVSHAVGFGPEDPVGLVESCYRAVEWLLATHTAKGL